MKVYIPTIDFSTIKRKSLFILSRPFWTKLGWNNESEEKLNWNISDEYSFTSDVSKANVYFIPKPMLKIER